MKLELLILGVTAFLIYNSYHGGKYTKMLMAWKKYYQMVFFAILGLGLYLMIKRSPAQGKQVLMHANNFVKYMPFDRSSMNILNPLFDFTSTNTSGFMEGYETGSNDPGHPAVHMFTPPGEKKLLQSGKGGSKRSVSETKKKYVASNQNWRCAHCNEQLNAWFEVDHKTRLADAGDNSVNNLEALCRECHGKKTAMENM